MKRPNILFVFADQWRYAALGASSNPEVRTPNLDRLASAGVVFDQAFSGYPLCSPYRGALLTGRYCHRNLVVDNEYRIRDGEVTLAHVLGREGYRTGFIGKWHLGYGPYPEEKRHGFGYLAGYDCGYGFYKTEYHENERGPIPFNCWSPEGETNLAIRFLEEHAKQATGSPFFLMLAWASPHWPYQEFPQEFNTFDPGCIIVPKSVPVQMKEFAAREIALYYGSVAALDHQMGLLLDALERLSLAEETIVVFTSDHGDHLSAHGFGKPGDRWLPPYMRASKATPYEESIHVPFIVRWPGRAAAGTRTPILLNTVDIMPTLLRLCEVEQTEGIQGLDLSHAVVGSEGPRPDSVYLQQMGLDQAAVRGRRPLRRWERGGEKPPRGPEERPLPDEGRGPFPGPFSQRLGRLRRPTTPWSNLAGRPEHGETQNELEARLQRWLTETGDPFDTGERDPRTGMLLLGQEFNDDRWKQPPPRERKP